MLASSTATSFLSGNVSGKGMVCEIFSFAALKRFWAAMISGLCSIASWISHFKSNGASASFISIITFLVFVCFWGVLLLFSLAEMTVQENTKNSGENKNIFKGILFMLRIRLSARSHVTRPCFTLDGVSVVKGLRK